MGRIVIVMDEPQDVFEHIMHEMEYQGYKLRSISGWSTTFHAEDYDGVKYLIKKGKNHYNVFVKTDIKLAL